MLCGKPLSIDGPRGPQLVGCGQCLNCRLNNRRQWTARILLEGLACEEMGGQVSWTTLTYADENMPYSGRGWSGVKPSLYPADYQLVFDRLRRPKCLGSFRFFLVGEYGEKTARPHYHALIFGPDTLKLEAALKQHWEPDYGHTRTRPWAMPEADYAGPRPGQDIKTARAAYCAAYCVKKLNGMDQRSADQLRGRFPEFARSSRRPGIGMTPQVLQAHYSKGGAWLVSETGDVARTVRLSGSMWPLSPTLRSWLREQLGIPPTLEERSEYLLPDVERASPTANDYLTAQAQHDKMLRQATPKGIM